MGLRADQRFAIAPVHLSPVDTLLIPLPQGLFWLQFHRARQFYPMPDRVIGGPVMCTPTFNQSVERVECLVRGPGAWVRLTHPSNSQMPAVSCVECRSRPGPVWRGYVEGGLSIEHEKYP